jgi:hypothetical protein
MRLGVTSVRLALPLPRKDGRAHRAFRLPLLAQSGSAPVFGLEASIVMTSSMLDVH